MAVFITGPPGNTVVKTAIFIRAVRGKSASVATNLGELLKHVAAEARTKMLVEKSWFSIPNPQRS